MEKKKHNICYGEQTEFKTVKDVENYLENLEKDLTKYEELKYIYTPGCWENKNDLPFMKNWNKKEKYKRSYKVY